MNAACAELADRGHPVFRTTIPGRTRGGWAIRSDAGATSDDDAR